MSSQKEKHRLKLGQLTFDIRTDHNIQLLITRVGRSDLPHLTINWGNPSGNINLHLTVTKKNNEKEYENIANFPESNLGMVFDLLGTTIWNFFLNHASKKVRIVTPGWLRRRGYFIYFINDNDRERLTQTLFPLVKYGKRKKPTYIPDEQRLRHLEEVLDISSFCFRPKILRELTLMRFNDPITAQCLYGKNTGRTLVLKLFPSDFGNYYWEAFPIDDDLIDFSDMAGVEFESNIKKLISEKAWNKIYTGMRLDEIGW